MVAKPRCSIVLSYPGGSRALDLKQIISPQIQRPQLKDEIRTGRILKKGHAEQAPLAHGQREGYAEAIAGLEVAQTLPVIRHKLLSYPLPYEYLI
ncbi:hypothetical protein NDU88_010733 [Pleurodeles waltl]|uniref:Uncharacterized protein n=1 Tax=Pleurodeles waltl TaxID=8319 RepID=A0AAV7QV86_PLEWA|nr:hypothetical protein NDU88_010733 [Pleurodeles waltl]